MRADLLRELEKITEEEQDILDGGREIQKARYTDTLDFTIDNKKLLSSGQLIAIRTHTRFLPFPKHKHNYVEVSYCCKGHITHVIDEKEVVLEAGDLLFLNQYTWHSVKAAGSSDIGVNFIILPEFFNMNFQFLERDSIVANFFVDLLRKNAHEGQYLHFKAAGVLPVQNLVENLIYSLIAGDVDSQNALNQATMGLLLLSLANHTDTLEASLPQQQPDMLLATVLQYIEESYKTASLSALAASTHQSLPSLSRFIQRNAGASFKELLQQKRLEKAAFLLKNTDLPVSDIIAAVGYENHSYFYRRFQAVYGVTPNGWRIGGMSQ